MRPILRIFGATPGGGPLARFGRSGVRGKAKNPLAGDKGAAQRPRHPSSGSGAPASRSVVRCSSNGGVGGGGVQPPRFRPRQPSSKSVTTRGGKLGLTMNALMPGVPLMAQSLGGAFVIDMGIQLVGWAFAATYKTEKFYDLCGSLAFSATAALTFASSAMLPRQVVSWTVRLGLFLLTRVMRDGGDSRFDEVKTQPGKFLVYWTLQGVWVWVTALPVFLINGIGRQSPLFWGDYLSLALWVAGFICETTADYQKYKFKQDPANKGRFINTGLWSLSRHPNYFGEILMWWAVAGVAVSMNASPLVSVAALASPLFVTFLLTQVSGVPILEKTADERWGNEAVYQSYKRSTPCLVPKLPGMARVD